MGLGGILSCVGPSFPFTYWHQFVQWEQGDDCVTSSIVLVLGSQGHNTSTNLETQPQSQPLVVPGVLPHFVLGYSNKNAGI